jgi:hypothetical protein
VAVWRFRLRVRLRRWLHYWDALIVIMAVGVLTGLITFMATSPSPAACHAAASRMHVPVRSLTWVCSHP